MHAGSQAGPPEATLAVTEAAWAELQGRLAAFIARRVNNTADVEDILQRVFLQLHRSLSTLRRTEGIHAWVYRTARHAVVDHYRSLARREVPSGDATDLERLGAAPNLAGTDVDHSELQQMAECLAPMIGRLPNAYRRAIVMTEIQGLTLHRAAVAEGISLSGMKSRVQRGRERLKEMLLECCQVALDRRGGIAGCESRQARCGTGRSAGGNEGEVAGDSNGGNEA